MSPIGSLPLAKMLSIVLVSSHTVSNVCVVCRECHFLVVSIITMLWFMCTPGVPLTPSNVMGAVKEVRWWWREGVVGRLAGWLHIPQSKQDEIKHNFPEELE